MAIGTELSRLHAGAKASRWLRAFTLFTRVAIAIGFLPSGLTKVLGNRFTLLTPDTPIGLFFEGLYQSGFYWRFIGLAQLLAAFLLLIPRTATFGALLFFPIITNIFVITVSLHFRGTWVITGLMLLANLYLLCWDWDKLRPIFRADQPARLEASTTTLESEPESYSPSR